MGPYGLWRASPDSVQPFGTVELPKFCANLAQTRGGEHYANRRPAISSSSGGYYRGLWQYVFRSVLRFDCA